MANLYGVNLTKASLLYANLAGAHLSQANLTDVDLRGANVTQVCLTGVEYDRKAMMGRYLGIRGLDSCVGNPVFKRDAQDQDYIDAFEQRSNRTLLGRVRRWLWAGMDFGRSIPSVALLALDLVLVFGLAYAYSPSLIDYGQHVRTSFTPYYFSMVTFSTLGFGDVTAGCLVGEVLVGMEVVLGYATLGLLLAILANTVARRS